MKGIRHARTEAGFEAWLGNNKGFLHWLISQYYHGETEHSDMFQEACIAAWKGYFRFDDSKGSKLNSYIGECVKNRILDIYVSETALRRPKTVPIGLRENFDDDGVSDYVLYEESYPSSYQYLFDALNDLDEQDRWVILETMFDKPQKEMAKELGCGQSLISYHLKRARKIMKEKIA